MPTVDLELQLKFLKELDGAIEDALTRYSDQSADKLSELNYMKSEVDRARAVVAARLKTNAASDVSTRKRGSVDTEDQQLQGVAI